MALHGPDSANRRADVLISYYRTAQPHQRHKPIYAIRCIGLSESLLPESDFQEICRLFTTGFTVSIVSYVIGESVFFEQHRETHYAGAWSCGMVAGLIHDIPTVQELIDRVMAEADELINRRLASL